MGLISNMPRTDLFTTKPGASKIIPRYSHTIIHWRLLYNNSEITFPHMFKWKKLVRQLIESVIYIIISLLNVLFILTLLVVVCKCHCVSGFFLSYLLCTVSENSWLNPALENSSSIIIIMNYHHHHYHCCNLSAKRFLLKLLM